MLAPLNDTWIEWIYIIDLDREVLTVNNGAHFKLDQVPHIDWINSLASGGLGDKISLPGIIPPESVTSLVAERTLLTSNLSQKLGDLNIIDVSSTFPYSLYYKTLITLRMTHPLTKRSFPRTSKTFLGVNAMDQS